MIPRHLERLLMDSLKHFPVVLLTGARQVGKSTLAEKLCRTAWPARYLTLDDRNLLDIALTRPEELIQSSRGPLAIDEIQRAPELLRVVKRAVDQNRKPGRFLLTGSANLMTLKRVSETLAGRIALHELYPFSFAESLKHKKPASFFPELFEIRHAEELVSALSRKKSISHSHMAAHFIHSGYPEPFLAQNASVRSRWFEAYRKTYIERDVTELSAIERLPDFNRLLTLAASRTGQVLNFNELGRDCGLPYVTLRRYMNILEQTYQTFLIYPFFINVSKRLMKAPKLYWSDAGMACHLLGIHDWDSLEKNPRFGSLLETWAASELVKLVSLSETPVRLYGWRTQIGHEVDFLIKKGNRFVALEVKASKAVEKSTVTTLQGLSDVFNEALVLSLVLYRGKESIIFGKKTAAIPLEIFFGS